MYNHLPSGDLYFKLNIKAGALKVHVQVDQTSSFLVPCSRVELSLEMSLFLTELKTDRKKRPGSRADSRGACIGQQRETRENSQVKLNQKLASVKRTHDIATNGCFKPGGNPGLEPSLRFWYLRVALPSERKLIWREFFAGKVKN